MPQQSHGSLLLSERTGEQETSTIFHNSTQNLLFFKKGCYSNHVDPGVDIFKKFRSGAQNKTGLRSNYSEKKVIRNGIIGGLN